MNTWFSLLLAVLISQSLAFASTVDQFLPWIAPNSVSFGTSFAEFKAAHPSAVDFSGKTVKPGEPFNGDLSETLPNGAILVYTFFDDKLGAASWMAPPTVEILKMLTTVRKSLLQTCGEPKIGTTGRVKAHGGVARVIWEEFRPNIDKTYQIMLKATSESGIEVDLINEPQAIKRGIKTTPLPYEDVERAVGAKGQSDQQASDFVDLLAAARADSGQSANGLSQSTETQNPGFKATEVPTMSPQIILPEPASPPATSSQYAESPLPVWYWWLGGACIVVLVLTAKGLRNRPR